MGRPKEHGEATRQALLDAAERIVESEDVDALTVRRVADEVGTTTRAVYSLFGSKEGLLVALAVRGFEILRANLDGQRLTGRTSRDVAVAGLAFRTFALEHPALFRLGVQRDLPDPALAAEFGEAARAAFARLVARIDLLREAGYLRPNQVHQAATQYHALCEGLAAVELRGALIGPGAGERIWRDALARLVAGFEATRSA